jgi:DNA-directed RNA polymerase specialized sigma24 family protein
LKSRNLKEEQAFIQKCRRYLERKKQRLIDMSGPGEMHSDRSYIDADAIHGGGGRREAYNVLIELGKIEADMKLLDEQEKDVVEQIKLIEEVIARYPKTADKVKALKEVKGMSLKEIAEELGYSYDWIRHVAMSGNTQDDTDKLKNQ